MADVTGPIVEAALSVTGRPWRRYAFLSVGVSPNHLTHVAGCYLVIHASGHLYVGSSVNLAGRIVGNRSSLRRGEHKNSALQQLFTSNPSIDVFVCPCADVAQAHRFEQMLVDQFSTSIASDGLPFAVNIATDDVLRSRKGRPLSEDHKQRMLKASLGVKRSPKARLNMSLAHAGVLLAEKHKAALSRAKKALYSTEHGKEAHARGIEKLSHEVVCDGVTYPSKSDAARALGVDVTTIMHRIKSPNFPTYQRSAQQAADATQSEK